LRTITSFGILGVILPLFLGCGPGVVQPNGKIVKGGQPVKVSDKGVIVLNFVPAEGGKEGASYSADTKPDGTFKIIGSDGKGIPPGKYKVAVQLFDPYPSNDLLKGKYAMGKTELTVDVGKEDVVIDVGSK
jgi:hypothetical protein